MKRGLVGIALLLVLLALGLSVSLWLGQRQEALAETLGAAVTLARNGDWEGADRLLRKAEAEWRGQWKLAAAVTDHAPLEEIDSMLSQLKLYAEQRELLSFAALCVQLEHRLRDIGEAQKLTWWNLL